LKKALRSGHELSLHGYKHAKNEFGYLGVGPWSIPLHMIPLPSLSNQKEKIEQAAEAFFQITEVRPIGFRAPWYLFNNQTLIALSNLGFRYDSSETIFKSVHNNLKIRWLSHSKPHWVHGLLEIPVTVDYAYNLSNLTFHNSLKRAIQDFEFIASQEGVFVINIHPNRDELDLLTRFLYDLINKIDGKTDFRRLVDFM
jgi:peptidoglycan/xylan/chitin deacetylase (PgdA/CDA1 family)